jgi:hypothetical protein
MRFVTSFELAKLLNMSNDPGWLRWSAGLSLLAAALTISLITSEVFDPKPVGHTQWYQPLAAHRIPAHSRRTFWLDPVLPEQDYSLRLTAAHLRGEIDSGYGLIIGSARHFLAAEVSSLGYVSLWHYDGRSDAADPASTYLLPWQTWPHVRTGAQPNEIWLERRGERITIRINRELMWQGEVGRFSGQIGLVGESFGDWAIVDFRELRLFTD